MKRKTSIILITLLLILALTYTQGFAASTAGKKTPTPAGGQAPVELGQPEPPGNGNPGGGEKHGNGKPPDNGDKPGKGPSDKGGPDNPKGPKEDKPGNGPKDPDAPKGQGKTVHLRGHVTSTATNSVTIDLPAGGDAVLDTADAVIHIPTLGKDNMAAALNIGVEITAKATQVGTTGNQYKAISINVIPGAPTHLHRVGEVLVYAVGTDGYGSITVKGPVEDQTFRVTPDTKILPKDATVAAGSLVTIVSPRDVTGGALTAKAIVVHPAQKSAP